jgi:hypothetical protein
VREQPPVRAAGAAPHVSAPANRTAPGFAFDVDASAQRSFDVAAPPLPSLGPVPFAPPDVSAFGAPPLGSPPFGTAMPAATPSHQAASDTASAFGFAYDDEPAPEARPAALEAAVMVAEVAKSADAATQKAAAEVAAMLKQMAVKGVDETVKPVKNAAKAFAAMLGAELAASEKKKPSTAGMPKVEATAVPAAEPEAAADEASAGEEDELPEEPELEPGALRPLQIGLSEALQQSIAEALRGYPEVEWACEVSDGSDTPVVGVRISPSFLTRSAEIERAILKAAGARRTSVRVLVLTEPALMRQARASGNTFFPWRKRPPRK